MYRRNCGKKHTERLIVAISVKSRVAFAFFLFLQYNKHILSYLEKKQQNYFQGIVEKRKTTMLVLKWRPRESVPQCLQLSRLHLQTDESVQGQYREAPEVCLLHLRSPHPVFKGWAKAPPQLVGSPVQIPFTLGWGARIIAKNNSTYIAVTM